MLNEDVSPSVVRCNFVQNKAAINGGAVSNHGTASPLFSGCVFEGNSAQSGGAADNEITSGSPRYSGCTFRSNRATQGGAAYVHAAFFRGEGGPAFTNCVFTGNTAQQGGALYQSDPVPTTVVGCTFVKNGSDEGRAVRNTFSAGTLRLFDSILWQDTGTPGPEISNEQSRPLVSHCLIQGSGGSGSAWDQDLGQDGGGNLDTDPRFVGLADPDGADNRPATADDGLRLRANSPCVDAGTSEGAAGQDILGVRRPNGAGFDLGAYERGPIPAPGSGVPAPAVGVAAACVLGLACSRRRTRSGSGR